MITLQTIQSKIFMLSGKKKLLFFSLGFLIVLILIFGIINSVSHSHSNNQNQELLTAINNMNQNLIDLRSQLNTELQSSTGKLDMHTQEQLQQLNQSLTSLGQEDMTLANNTDQKITTTHADTLAKLAVISSSLQMIKKAVVPPTYLDVNYLPFNVVGVDYWNGEPKVTIFLDGENDLIGKGETRSGWTVIEINADQHNVVFQNAKKQLVKVEV